MTAFFTPCCTRIARSAFRLLLALACAWPLAARAGGIEVRSASLQATEEGYELAADFAIDFPPLLEEAVARGVTLYFVAEFELLRPRWYWFDERSARRAQTWRLSYHALTRQYRISTGALHQSFATLSDALSILARLRRWQVLERKDVRLGETYQASLRLQLDLSQMPKPFQLNAFANREWDLGSDWHTLNFVPGQVPAPPTAEAR